MNFGVAVLALLALEGRAFVLDHPCSSSNNARHAVASASTRSAFDHHHHHQSPTQLHGAYEDYVESLKRSNASPATQDSTASSKDIAGRPAFPAPSGTTTISQPSGADGAYTTIADAKVVAEKETEPERTSFNADLSKGDKSSSSSPPVEQVNGSTAAVQQQDMRQQPKPWPQQKPWPREPPQPPQQPPPQSSTTATKRSKVNNFVAEFLRTLRISRKKPVDGAVGDRVDENGTPAVGSTNTENNGSTAASMTERIMKRTAKEAQATGAGGVSTWEAFQRVEANWSRLKAFQPFTYDPTSSNKKNIPPPPQFVTQDVAMGNPACWEKLLQAREQPLDFDVVICGGTLGVFFALALRLKGHSVCVLEAGELRGREQEWNISMIRITGTGRTWSLDAGRY